MTSAPFCDLHTHTLHSDGMLTPGELVELAAARGVRVLAVTDHDTLGGTAAAVRRGRSLGIEVIEGIELSVDMHGRELHLLGYFVQRPSALEEGLAEIRSAREVRARRIVGRLGELGMPVEYAAVWGRARGDVVGRPHVAEELVERGFATSLNDAFDRLLGDGKPAHVAKRTLSLQRGLELLRGSGAVTSLAHPQVSDAEDLVPALCEAGLRGLEVWHPAQDAVTTARYLDLARRLGLVPTGGSDFHRETPGGILPGDVGVTREVFEELRSTAG